MSAEIVGSFNISKFFESKHYQSNTPRQNWTEADIESMYSSFLWKPVVIGTTADFMRWVFEQTKRKETPPYRGILNLCDNDGNFVLSPWFRQQDYKASFEKFLNEPSDLKEKINVFMNAGNPENLAEESKQTLIIPRSELTMIDPYLRFY
ncbi:hypothetical protein ACFL1Q_02945 [Patescibacteria group bacterium]